MSSPIPEHEISRIRIFRDKFFIVDAVLNIIMQATAFSKVFFFYIKVRKMKEQLVTSNLCFFLSTLACTQCSPFGACKVW